MFSRDRARLDLRILEGVFRFRAKGGGGKRRPRSRAVAATRGRRRPAVFFRLARGELLAALIGFAVCQLALAVAVDCWLDAVRDPEFAYKLQRLQALRAEAPDRPLVLVLGTSRTNLGLHADLLSKSDRDPLVFNFGIAGAGPLTQAVTLRRLLDAGIRPDLLYLEIMPALLSERLGGPVEESLLDTARLRWDEVGRSWPNWRSVRRCLGNWALGRLLPVYRHQAELRELVDNLLVGQPRLTPPAAISAHGWWPHYLRISPEEQQVMTDLARRQYAEALAQPQLAPEPLKALEELLELCRREQLAVALVLMPEGSDFRALHQPQARAPFEALLRRLEQDWQVPIVDARCWVQDSGFWDTHHLLPTGARAFTRRFGRESIRPLLQARLGPHRGFPPPGRHDN
jgi:hypothetical protein